MAGWQRKLDLRDVWNKVDTEELTVQELSTIVADRLEKLKAFDNEDNLNYEKSEFIDEFRDLAKDSNLNIDDFDCVLDRLYDWGDTQLDNKTLTGKKVCWIATQF
jgi:hypothetical protein